MAAQSLNEECSKYVQLYFSEATLIFGEGAQLDSLSRVSVIGAIETAVSYEWGEPIRLIGDRARNRVKSRFAYVRSMTDYIVVSLSEKLAKPKRA